jgi:hypothetical protein
MRNTRSGCGYLCSHGTNAKRIAACSGLNPIPERPMTDINTILAKLRRPRLLIRAARFGLNDYNRTRDLKRVMGGTAGLKASKVIDGLIDKEALFEDKRKKGDATYNVVRHVEVLIALMAEAHLLPRGPQSV